MSRFTWAIDGHGTKHYLCDYCFLVFGDVDPDTINHQCDPSKPRYHNRNLVVDNTVNSMK